MDENRFLSNEYEKNYYLIYVFILNVYLLKIVILENEKKMIWYDVVRMKNSPKPDLELNGVLVSSEKLRIGGPRIVEKLCTQPHHGDI